MTLDNWLYPSRRNIIRNHHLINHHLIRVAISAYTGVMIMIMIILIIIVIIIYPIVPVFLLKKSQFSLVCLSLVEKYPVHAVSWCSCSRYYCQLYWWLIDSAPNIIMIISTLVTTNRNSNVIEANFYKKQCCK